MTKIYSSAINRIAALVLASIFWLSPIANAQYVISGELKKWHKVTITFDSGINTSETATQNPFADYRLNVTFTNGSKSYLVPGYYAADGNAANSSSNAGSKWRVHFCPNETGTWNYQVSFRTSPYIAISDVPTAGTPVTSLDGLTGSFNIQPTDKTGSDFRGQGKLRYVGKHHLQFAETGKYFVKGGSNSPENFLAYFEFDGTYDNGGEANNLVNGLHQYSLHIQDWQPGNPSWQNGKGKGIIGAMNYLASQELNAICFLTMNTSGDANDVWPYISPLSADRERFDVSKLDQWEILFSHMDSLGILLHFLTQERENEMLLDGGNVGTQRRLYYRELIARFSHHLAIIWNLGEENGRGYLDRGAQNDQQRKDMATYFKTHDPYQNFVTVHAYDNLPIYTPLLGYPDFDGTSHQDYYQQVHNFTVQWLTNSANAGRKWVIFHDETRGGVPPDNSATNHFTLRKSVLWGNLMAGGGGVEWFLTHDEQEVEDFRTRANMWKYTRNAIQFFNSHLPFSEMKNNNALTSTTSDYCFELPGKVYAVYMPNSSSTNINLPCGNYSVKWFDPKNGGTLQNGSVLSLVGNGNRNLGTPPYSNEDWVALVINNYSVNFNITNIACATPQGSITANVSGGIPPYAYLWSAGQTTQSISSLPAGNYTVTIADNTGCTTTGNAIVSNSAAQGSFILQQQVAICEGESYFAGGVAQTISGIYADTLDGIGICDTVIITSLSVQPASAYNVAVSICAGKSHVAGGTLQTQSGIYTDTFSSSAGCDSIVVTTLTVKPTSSVSLQPVICQGKNFIVGNHAYNTPGIYRDTLISINGCDSIVTTSLTVLPGSLKTIDTTICIGESYFAGKALRTVSGIYRDTFIATNGCDSIIITNLTVSLCGGCPNYDCNGVCQGSALVDECGRCVNGNTGLNPCTDCALRINNLSLMYEGTFGEVGLLTNGKVINRDTLCRFNIRANICKMPIGSVKFVINGSTFRVENTAPYALNGDSPVGYYTPWIPAPGSYILVVIPYSGSNASGTAGTSVTVNFSVINPGAGVPVACLQAPKFDCNGNLNGTAFIDGCGICSGGLTGHAPDSDKDNCGICFGNNSTCCTSNAQCIDNNPCTVDLCVNGSCLHTSLNCNDNNLCTADACVNGACTYTPLNCNDNNACTADACANGICTHAPVSCNDGNACTTDACNTLTGCTNTPINCNDNIVCTTDACVNGVCIRTPISCNDGNPCTTDACNPVTGCTYTPLYCNDNNACTTDACVNGTCNYTSISCNDGNPCTTDACNPVTGCTYTPLNCNDNNACTTDACANGACIYTPISCNDGNPCTTDACNPATGCTYTPMNCNDNNACTTDLCANGICTYTPMNCNDNNVCTADVCVNGICTYTPGNCRCTSNSQCNDNSLCTYDLCVTGVCLNAPLNCNDNNICTEDFCVNGICINAPISCSDGNACTIDNCNTTTGCTHAPVICNDNNICTSDNCVNGTCLYTPVNCGCTSNAQCNDNDPCTADQCINSACIHLPASNEPSYLKVLNVAKSWKKLKLGFVSNNLYTPLLNVAAGGNNQVCITLRNSGGNAEWSKIQFRPQGNTASIATLSDYITGAATDWTTFCIPFSAFPAFNFSQISYMEFPFSNGANPFEIHIQKIIFTGGSTPFLWFGDSQTNNLHDGQSGNTSTLLTTLVQSNPCGAPKYSGEETVLTSVPEKNIFLNAYPNPFSEEVTIEFRLDEDSKARIEIVNLEGRLVSVVFYGEVKAGDLQAHTFRSDALSNGMYFYRLITEKGEVQNRKLILFK